MFYWLIDLSNTVPGFGVFRSILNVFRYITFRTGGAVETGALFVFWFGAWIIDHLRLRQGKGQPIRSDGPQSHIISKKGTPTMGGLMILSGLVVATVLWANPANPYVWVVLGVTLGFGSIGLYDDYLKVTKQSHAGFSGWTRLLIEFLIAGAACYAIAVLAEYLQVNFVSGAGELAVLCGAILGAGLGFLWFNCPPASIFMGDTGSLALGGLLGTVAVITKHEIVLGIIGGLFVLEAVSVIVQVISFK